MKIKEAVYEKVTQIVDKRISDEVYGCDECREEIIDFPNESQRLEVTVFRNDNSESDHLHFCSWACVFKYIPKISTDYFVNLPFVYYDEAEGSKRDSKALLEIIKRMDSVKL